MTDLAAIQGTFADFKTVKSRSVVQIVIEIPIEAGKRAIDILGFPQPGAEIPVALARLDLKHVSAPVASSAPAEVPAGANGITSSPSLEGDVPAREDGIPGHQPVTSRSWNEIPYAQRAGIRCNEPMFQRFAFSEYGIGFEPTEPPKRAEAAAGIIRKECGVCSRSEIKRGTEAARIFDDIERNYFAWLKYEQVPA
jgi:hypothetical protein